jgi:hypothetical protein
MQIKVYFEDDHMATVDAPQADVEDALEYAFRWTQNIQGSWSLPGNPDYNPRVTLHGPLPTIFGGQPIGVRSSMVGDRLAVEGGSTYVVSAFGFRELTQ